MESEFSQREKSAATRPICTISARPKVKTDKTIFASPLLLCCFDKLWVAENLNEGIPNWLWHRKDPFHTNSLTWNSREGRGVGEERKVCFLEFRTFVGISGHSWDFYSTMEDSKVIKAGLERKFIL